MGYQEILIEVKNLKEVKDIIEVVEKCDNSASIIEILNNKENFKKGDKFVWVYGERHPACDILFDYGAANKLKVIDLDYLMANENIDLYEDSKVIDLQ